MKHHILSILIISGIFIVSCQKEKYKKPTSIDFKFEMNQDIDNSSTIRFQKGSILLNNIDVIGSRIKGGDINFNKQLTTPILVDLTSSSVVNELHLDLPQGDYTELSFNLNLESDEENPCVYLSGHYKPDQSSIINVIFEIDAW